jgi:hypothetical protein
MNNSLGVVKYLGKNFLIAVDQLVNVFVWSSQDGRFGSADETLSARAWRLRKVSQYWATFRIAVDVLFFFAPNHCQRAYEHEFNKHQLPSEYQEEHECLDTKVAK